jgi:hypothetical protein
VRLKFIFYFQILEYSSYYYLDNKIQNRITQTFRNPEIYDKPEDFSKIIIEEMKDHFSQKDDSIKLEKTITENVIINDIKNEIEVIPNFIELNKDKLKDWTLDIFGQGEWEEMLQNKIISFMKIAFNPFRIISLFFLYISRFFGFFADLFDNISQKISFKINPKSKPDIGEKQGKFIIILLLIVLIAIWSNYLSQKGIL